MPFIKDFISKLRNSSLRPTRQRMKICQVLFDRDQTFHFSIGGLAKIIENQSKDKISLATIYNTVHALTKKGHLKEVLINTNQSYFDTNIEHHHHMYDETKNELIDLNQDDINSVEIKRKIPGKKIKSIEVLVKITSVK